MDSKQSRVVSALADALRRSGQEPERGQMERFRYREVLWAVATLFDVSIDLSGITEHGEEYLVQQVAVPAHAMFDVLEEFKPEWVTEPIRCAAVQILLSDPSSEGNAQDFDRALLTALKMRVKGEPYNWVLEAAESALLCAARYENDAGEFPDVRFVLMDFKVDPA